MTVQNYSGRQPITGPTYASRDSLASVVEMILDKGLVIDVYVRIKLLGLELLTIEARVIVASVDTYLRLAEAALRLKEANNGEDVIGPLAGASANSGQTLGEFVGDTVGGVGQGVGDAAGNIGSAGGKAKSSGVRGAIENVKDAITGDDEEEDQESQPTRKRSQSPQRRSRQ